MKVYTKTKKMIEKEVIEEKDIDIEKLINVLKNRLDNAKERNSDMVNVSVESLEDALLILENDMEMDKRNKTFEDKIPKDMLDELKAMAAFLTLNGVKP